MNDDLNAQPKTVEGALSFSVYADCPYCDETIDLADVHDDDNLLAGAVFGSKDEPCKWDDIEIEYICPHCEKEFILGKLVY